MSESKTLPLRQTWFLGIVLGAVVLVFAFVILPYVDPKPKSAAGQEAPAFGLELLAGGEPGDRVRLADLRGRVVVLDFFASWCMPCREQAVVIEQVAREFEGKDVYVLGVGTSDDRDALMKFIGETKPSYPAAFDEGNVVANAYGVSALPTLVVVDRAGRILDHQSRVVSKRELTELVDAALSAN
jgi:cytochrome c biogenesis protein CcmG/thiol:disulfide interchange protein DsbE